MAVIERGTMTEERTKRLVWGSHPHPPKGGPGTPNFRAELEKLLNRFSMENGSNTPDFVLAGFLWNCLVAYDAAVVQRDQHLGALTMFTPRIKSDD
jgi:hypothetical protein